MWYGDDDTNNKKTNYFGRRPVVFRATSHTRLTARDHYTSSTLVGGKGGASPKFASRYV
jgi:hypothetical protein